MARILIVDDSELVRVKLRAMLEQLGCDVSEAPNGVVALDIYTSEYPELVICDINMPEMDGLEFLETLIDREPNALVVMLTSIEDDEVLTKCLMAGAQAYLTKPFDPETTYNTLNDILGNL